MFVRQFQSANYIIFTLNSVLKNTCELKCPSITICDYQPLTVKVMATVSFAPGTVQVMAGAAA